MTASTPHRVAILALPSVVPFDLGVPMQVFAYGRPDLGVVRYDAVVCGARRGRLEATRGYDLYLRHGLSALRHADTIVIPGVDDFERTVEPAVLRALQRAHARGARIASICTGSFVLAATGLLDGRRATTHWLDVPDMRRRFPNVSVDPDVLYIDEGRLLTSAGIASGIDLCLHLVYLDHGAAVANAVARRLVVSPHRAGGQAQFIPEPVADPHGLSLEATRTWALARLHTPLTVDALARHAGVPLRSFTRRFAAECGTSPLRWLLRQRLFAAQRQLESTHDSIATIARATGFGAPVSLRAHFRRALCTSPLAYRRAFQRDGDAGPSR